MPIKQKKRGSNKRQTRPEKRAETRLEVIASYAALAVTLLFIMTFNLQAFAIPSGSMEKTLLVGDHVLVDRISLAPSTSWMPLLPYREIRRGDIIVFFKPGEPGLHLVKRVVGIPGDRVHLRRGILYINGAAQTEPYAIHSTGDYSPFRDDFPSAPPTPQDSLTPGWRRALPQHSDRGDLIVPANSYFALGDNRDNSLDSRYWGFVPHDNVIGTPLFIYWSFAASSDEYLKDSIPDQIGHFAHVAIHFFDETRWNRMFRVVH
jgi:signal peptidase I